MLVIMKFTGNLSIKTTLDTLRSHRTQSCQRGYISSKGAVLPVPSPEQSKSGGTSRKWGRGLYDKLNFCLQKYFTAKIMRYFQNFVFMSKKRYKAGSFS